MPGQHRRHLVEMIGFPFGDGLGHRGVKVGPSAGQHRLVGDLLGQGVPETVLRLRMVPGLLEELGGAQGMEGTVQFLGASPDDPSQQRLGEGAADYCGGLEQPFLGGRQTIDPSGEHCMHAGRHPDVAEGACQAVGARMPGQGAVFQQIPHQLFDEEGVAARALQDEADEGNQRRFHAGLRPQQPAEQLAHILVP